MTHLELAAPSVSSATADTPLLPLVSDGLRVPTLGGEQRRYVDLDVAATAPALRAVADRVAELLPYTGSVHRGAGLPSRWSTQLLGEARERVARSVGARADDLVVFTRNTTDSLNLLACAVPAGAGVLTLDIEHHANLLPWQRRDDHRVVAHAPTIDETLVRIASELDRRPAALVAITGASNVTGELIPIETVVHIAHSRGARVAIDGAQLIPHGTIDLAESGVDYVAFSGHKLYAPFGTGVLAGRRDWLDLAQPYLAGGGAVQHVTTDGAVWADGAARHEAGTPNLLGAVAVAEALDLLAALPSGALAGHERVLRERLELGLDGVRGVSRHSIWSDGGPRVGTVCFTVEGVPSGLAAAVLSAEHAIGVRDGRFCAHPLIDRLGLSDEGAVRASIGVGTTRTDIDRLVSAVRCLAAHGPHAAYERVAGAWRPVGDDRHSPAQLALGAASAAAAAASPCNQSVR
jgi:selenocysteine lyase/cysteine desulfurase